MTEDVAARKEAIRHEILAARARRSQEALTRTGAALAEQAALRWRELRTVAAYLSFGSEPPTGPSIEGWLDDGVRVLLPVIDGADLDWAVCTALDEVEPGPLGISEPSGRRLGASAVQQADLVVVPALAVDRSGRRLGRGRGYYDRALREVSAPVAAVVFDDEVLDELPDHPHDRRVDLALRPSGVIDLR
ncbi:MAG TPA: 5-formyltetrahydrofolate cyclo-ligase [Mycobacteriales bacterium]|nr:5-formyltetrahydrofolate cyclo-ligase [Mycobacteriales bacterium]